MAKQKKGKQVSAPPPTSKRVYQGILAVAVIGAMVSIYFFAGRDNSSSVSSPALPAPSPAATTSTNPALRNRLILPAIPQRPRPITLEPTAFADPEIRASYQAAKDSPEALGNRRLLLRLLQRSRAPQQSRLLQRQPRRHLSALPRDCAGGA